MTDMPADDVERKIYAITDEIMRQNVEARITGTVSRIIERSTGSSHHHATRKAMTREIVEAVMSEIDAGRPKRGRKP